ncbi:MAG TPA: pilus assembly protein TadG-related protein, partial [Candidatus Limnocylindria bacterium]
MGRGAAGIRDEGGQILIMTALLLTVLLFAVGIAFNLGTLFVERRTMQEAVDAAAFGGSVVLFNGGTNAAAVSAATTDLSLNGYSASNLMLTIVSPPTSGTYAYNVDYVAVTASRRVETPLLPSEGGTTLVGVSATAGAFGKASNFAFMAISPSATNAFQVNNSADVTVTGGSVQVNSSAATAATKSGAGQLNLTGGTAKSVGGQTGFSSWTTGQASQPDPLSGFLRPSTIGVTTYGAQNLTTTTTLQPGIYSGGINISGNGTITFAAGTFILAGGGLSVTGTPRLVGTGVTFFNTLTNYPTETGTCGPVSLGGTSEMQIDAP